ncbi:protein inturned [Microplitis mediator]|uniref:protein inturned n=1 Tax=Microplitis mediator TaxID=375433 RepID=UPI00255545BF|nr:protein inturned [Microplitis mediator]
MDRFSRLDRQEAGSSSMRYEERQGTSATIDEEDEDDEQDEEEDHEDDDEWWASDSGSSSGSYYSDSESCSDSSYAEWELDIGPLGEVFYIESLSEAPGSNKKPEKPESPPPELKRKRSTRAGKLMRLIRRRESKRYSKRNKNYKGTDAKQEGNAPKEGSKEVKFQDYQAGEIKEVMLWVDPERRHKLGRRATMCEAYLGIVPGDFSDKVRVMVAGFIPNGEAIKNKNIKIGDWLRSINNCDVSADNLEQLLGEITTPMSVKLQLQRVAGIEVTEEAPSSVPRQSARVRRLVDRERSKKFMDALLDYSFGVIYLQTSGLSETGPEMQGVLYTYPRSENKSLHSILCTARGAFVTLNHLLPDTFSSSPSSTTISVGSEQIHVLYVARDDELLLLAVPERWYSLNESRELLGDIVRTLEFSYATLNKCFADEYNHLELDHMFYLAFTRLLGIDNDEEPVDDEVYQLKSAIERREKCEFERIVAAAHHVQLPVEAQFEIDCALNEMEAMDYREWNEDPMDCQPLYTILGTCVYHKSYLLTSHIMHVDYIEIHSFLRMSGLLDLIEKEPVKSLVVWRSVYPRSCHRGIITDPKTQFCVPDGKWFVLVVGYETELLVSLFETGGDTAQPIIEDGPDIFYVEEAQETLRHIQKVGVPTYASKWILSNARPETIDIKDKLNVKTHLSLAENLLGLIKSADTPSTPAKSTSGTIKKVPEVTSILKKRSPEQSPVITGSMYSFQASEESLSQGGAVSEVSDDGAPILGRRALREKILAQSRVESDESDTEIEMYRECQQQQCPFDFTDIRESLLSQSDFIPPIRITSGPKNVLIHFVQLDLFEGVLMSPKTIEHPEKNAEIISTFNECAHTIHRLLSNTVRFKSMASEDLASVPINKNLVAIKEHGILFDYESVSFWVIGRLFETPCLREFYVCYEDSVPQNLIEMAFRLQGSWH